MTKKTISATTESLFFPDEDIEEIIEAQELTDSTQEKLDRRVQLKLQPTLYNMAKAKAIKDGRSFNNYIIKLITEDLKKDGTH